MVQLEIITFIYLFLDVHTLSTLFRLMRNNIQKTHFEFDSAFELLFFCTNGILYHFLIYNFANISILAVTLGNTLTFSIFIMIKQTNQIFTLNKLSWAHFFYFKAKFIPVLQCIFSANVLFGKIFTLFLVVNFPLNAYLVIFLLFG